MAIAQGGWWAPSLAEVHKSSRTLQGCSAPGRDGGTELRATGMLQNFHPHVAAKHQGSSSTPLYHHHLPRCWQLLL